MAAVVGTSLLYTVPAGRTLIVRSAYYYNVLGVGGSIDWQVVPSGGVAISVARLVSTATVGGSASLGNVLILNPGDSLQVVTTTSMNVNVFGSLLNGAPA